jgi:membrane fusion protein, multidrug efflux system
MKPGSIHSLIIITLVSLLPTSCGRKEEGVQEVLRPVRYTQVFSSGGTRTRTFAGTAQAGTESNLSFRVAGIVQRVPVKVGSEVRAGQILAQLDPTDYELQFKEAKAARDQARAREIQAKAQYERTQSLYENRNASASDLEAAHAAYEFAHEQDNIQKRRRDLAERQVEYTTLRAPVTGAVADVTIDVNENVRAGQTVLVMTSGSQLEVSIPMPEILISQVREGQEVTVTFDALPGRAFPATVSEVGVASTGYGTTFPVMVRLRETTADIRPGMAAEVGFTFSSTHAHERFVVPPVAVGEDRNGRFVFVVDSVRSGTGVAMRKPVTIGELDDDGLEVLTGLEDGDYVITAGVSKIEAGQKVKFEPARES